MSVNIKKGSAGGIDMTPMIDVVFQLLIFFIVATKIDEDERALTVRLPTASEAKPLTSKPEEVNVMIRKDGVYYINNRKMTIVEIENTLIQLETNNPDRVSVRISGDQSVEYQKIIAVLNACQKAKITNYRLDAQVQ
jgi:biopolymer transport protein ExbD